MKSIEQDISPDEQIDDLNFKGLKIIQNRKRFMFGIDAIILSSFAKVKRNEEVIDLGTGTGIIPVLLAGKTQASRISGIEVQKESALLAEKTVALNGLEAKINIINDDLCNIEKHFAPQSVNVVTSNPPYMKKDSGTGNSTDEIGIARREILCTLEDVVKAASYVLKPNGRFYMIHKPERLSEIVQKGAEYNLEIKRLRFVQPMIEKEATMVLVEYVKCAGSGMIVEKPLIVYKEKGVYTDEVMEIYGKCQEF